VVGQTDRLLARYAAAVPAALVLGVTKVVGTALLQTRSVQRGDAVKVANRTLARLIDPPLVQATAITLRAKRKNVLLYDFFCIWLNFYLANFLSINIFVSQYLISDHIYLDIFTEIPTILI